MSISWIGTGCLSVLVIVVVLYEYSATIIGWDQRKSLLCEEAFVPADTKMQNEYYFSNHVSLLLYGRNGVQDSMTLFITAVEPLNQECEKHDLSGLVPDLLSAETSAGAGGGSKQFFMSQGNFSWPVNTHRFTARRDRYVFSGLGKKLLV